MNTPSTTATPHGTVLRQAYSHPDAAEVLPQSMNQPERASTSWAAEIPQGGCAYIQQALRRGFAARDKRGLDPLEVG